MKNAVCIFIYYLLIILLSPVIGAQAASPSEQNSATASQDSMQIVMMPFINHSGHFKAIESFTPRIIKALNDLNISVYDLGELRNILRRHRIRSLGTINNHNAQIIKKETGINYILLGSFDFYKAKSPSEVGLSFRILSIDSMKIIYADSYSLTSIDKLKIFGFGRVKGISPLIKILLDKMFSGISLTNIIKNQTVTKAQPTIAIIGFDNISSNQRAGEIVSSQLLTHLFKSGFRVMEPGVIKEVMYSSQSIMRGETNYDILERLNSEKKVDLVITGIVDSFIFSRGRNGEYSTAAKIEIRILNAHDYTLLFIGDKSKKGSDSEKIFRLGKCHSLGQLSNKIIKQIMNDFLKGNDYANK